MVRMRTEELLLGEWACLGILSERPAHGYDVAMRLSPAGDIGRVWSLSRPLTYRAIDQLVGRGLLVAVSEETGVASGNRTIVAPTVEGKAVLQRWLAEPVTHLREVRTQFLLKLVLSTNVGLDTKEIIAAQREVFAPMAAALRRSSRESAEVDPVEIWRNESSRAVVRFLQRLAG